MNFLANLVFKGVFIMTNGIFGDLFDFDGDGNLDVFEQSMEFMFLDELMKTESNDDDLD
jgi:hypothetical protein